MAESVHVGNMPLQDLAEQMRTIAKKFADDSEDILKAMVFHAIANRLEKAVEEIRDLKATLENPYTTAQLHQYLDEAHQENAKLTATLAVRDQEARDRLKKVEQLQGLLDDPVRLRKHVENQMDKERLVNLGPG